MHHELSQITRPIRSCALFFVFTEIQRRDKMREPLLRVYGQEDFTASLRDTYSVLEKPRCIGARHPNFSECYRW